MKIILFANTDWYLYNFRLSLAATLIREGHDVLLISPEGEYVSKFKELGLEWKSIPMDRRSLNPVGELATIYRLARLLKNEKPDLIHSFTIKCAVYGSLAARISSVPARVSAVEGLGYVFSSNHTLARLLRPVVRCLLRLALAGPHSRLILLNRDDVELFIQHSIIDAKNIKLIRGAGVDCDRFAPVQHPVPSSPSSIKVLLAARLLWEKGIREYVEASKLVNDANPGTQFLLAGAPDSGNPAAVSESTLQQWVDDGLITWLGHVNDMATLLQKVDIVVLPSYYREGLPTSLTEGAASGLPLVTCDTPGCREVVDDYKEGFLVPSRDPVSLAEAINQLIESPSLRNSFGKAARVRALNEFDVKIVIRKTVDLYHEITAN